MTDRETTRLIAWSSELRRVHTRLREALRLTRATIEHGGDPPNAARELLVYCRGFCVALDEHHRGENRSLFPAIEARHPELAPVLRNLEQDHSILDFLLTALNAAVDRSAGPAELGRHLDGIGALMESHFAYEERQLLDILDTLELHADPGTVLGSL